MNPIYIIRENEIYELVDEKTAKKIEIVDGIPQISKETIKYEKESDNLYTFSEIKSKLSYLFEKEEISLENEDEYKAIIEEKDKTIASLQAKVKELEELVDKLTKELEELKTSTPNEEENNEEESKKEEEENNGEEPKKEK